MVGYLNWVTQCIYGGRFHMRRLIDVSSRLCHLKHRVRMTLDMRDDIDFWLEFIPTLGRIFVIVAVHIQCSKMFKGLECTVLPMEL